MQVKDVLTAEEAAEYLRLDRDTLKEFESRGLVAVVRLPAFKGRGEYLGKKLYRRESLDAFLKKHEKGGQESGPFPIGDGPEVSETIGHQKRTNRQVKPLKGSSNE